MKCPNCNAEVHGAKFCPECGTKISQERICSKCGTKLNNNAKFCPECGNAYGSSVAVKKSAKIYKTWVDHNVYQDGEKGMLIHVKFDVQGQKNISDQCVAYFYFSNGTQLKDYNDKYKTTAGYVCAFKNYCPSYDDAVYNDFQIFMPYDELHCSGNLDLKFYVIVWGGNDELATSEWIYFSYSDGTENQDDDGDDDGDMTIAEGIGAFAGGFLAGLLMDDDDDY
ncbi:MAG: zinc ribbon domain-containing protein [Bacteroidales bacterium]|nr:zinc ribbon domain-containing protein [Bacteroidales bacterium]